MAGDKDFLLPFRASLDFWTLGGAGPPKALATPVQLKLLHHDNCPSTHVTPVHLFQRPGEVLKPDSVYPRSHPEGRGECQSVSQILSGARRGAHEAAPAHDQIERIQGYRCERRAEDNHGSVTGQTGKRGRHRFRVRCGRENQIGAAFPSLQRLRRSRALYVDESFRAELVCLRLLFSACREYGDPPMAFAKSTAMCPSPPNPITAALCPGRKPA
jgi:hypothetical protein